MGVACAKQTENVCMDYCVFFVFFFLTQIEAMPKGSNQA